MLSIRNRPRGDQVLGILVDVNRGDPLRRVGGHGLPNFSKFIKLPFKFPKFFKKYMAPPLQNFLNIRFLLLNLSKIFKRNMISLQNLHISCMTLLNWFNFIFIIILASIHKILVSAMDVKFTTFWLYFASMHG